jgi:hypothetical protein
MGENEFESPAIIVCTNNFIDIFVRSCDMCHAAKL